jgi:hypothetical protein
LKYEQRCLVGIAPVLDCIGCLDERLHVIGYLLSIVWTRRIQQYLTEVFFSTTQTIGVFWRSNADIFPT